MMLPDSPNSSRTDAVALTVLIAVALAHLTICVMLATALLYPEPETYLITEGIEYLCKPLP